MDNLTIRQVKAAANVVDVLGEFLELRRKGSEYTALCPFHDDRHHGNFMVSPSKNIYHCFACGANGDPIDFLCTHAGMSFADAIRWLGKKYGIPVDGADKFDVKACSPHTPPPPLPTLYLPSSMVASKQSTDNALCRWLDGLPWAPQQRARIKPMLEAYKIGTSRWGDVIFWQIDQYKAVRDGKLMRYKADGHRDKECRYGVNWVSSLLGRHGWFDVKKWEVRRTLFGMHLLQEHPTAEVHVVESEKTALFASIYYGNHSKHIWMATGGKSNLSAERLKPIIDARRDIAFHPDKDGVEMWQRQLEALNYRRAYINDNVFRLFWQEEDGRKADLADVLARKMTDNQTPLVKLAFNNQAKKEYAKK